jgi:pimeloyl-ACP methyl ester carboxylesterase
VSFLVLLWWQQERILFQPPGHVEMAAVSAKRIDFVAADGQRLYGFLLGNVSAGNVLLCFHGNADLAYWQLDWARDVNSRFELSVFLAEYRGYGGTAGNPTYETSRLDAEAAYDILVQMGAVPENIFFFGHSLGSAVATELALRHPTRTLILQSPFTSARDMARLTVARPFASLWNLVSRIHFNVVDTVRRLDARVSVIHGTRDLVIPHRMGQEVFRAAKVPGVFALIEKAGHNNVLDVAGENYWIWFASALQRPTAESAGP